MIGPDCMISATSRGEQGAGATAGRARGRRRAAGRTAGAPRPVAAADRAGAAAPATIEEPDPDPDRTATGELGAGPAAGPAERTAAGRPRAGERRLLAAAAVVGVADKRARRDRHRVAAARR